jgi:hypothetical protein
VAYLWGDDDWGVFFWGWMWDDDPPTPPPPEDIVPSITEAEILALIAGAQLTVDFGAELLDANDLVVEDISDDLTSGTVEHNNYADVHGTCSLELTRALDWATVRIRPYQTLTGSGYTQTWPLGVYLLTTPETAPGEDPVTYDVSGYDKLHLLQNAVGDTYVVTTGTGYLDAVRAAITASGATGLDPLLDGTDQDLTLPAPMVWMLDPAAPASWLRVINDLLGAIGYRGLWADATGRYCSEPYQSPLTRSPLWSFDVSDQATVIVGEDRTLTTDNYVTTNWWRFVQNGLDAQPIEGTGFYTVDLSGGGAKVKAVVALDVAGQTSLVARGDAIVQSTLQIQRTLSITTGPLPILGHFDVVLYRDLDAGLDCKAQVHSWRVPLDGSDTSLTLEVL